MNFSRSRTCPGIRLQWVRSPKELAGLAPNDWIILPGSKSDQLPIWTGYEHRGLDAAVAAHAAQGGAVLGVFVVAYRCWARR
jgi:adenosylcobyric acid synthase